MHRKIRATLQQRFFNLLGEEALRADLVERHAGNLIAGSLNDLDAAFLPQGGQLLRNPASLPKR